MHLSYISGLASSLSICIVYSALRGIFSLLLTGLRHRRLGLRERDLIR